MIDARRYLQGQTVDGQFPLLQYLGGTEHSSVFLTECSEAEDRRAAIKLIAAPPGRAEARLTRWRLAARFSHPHLQRLFHAGRCTLDNTSLLYVVMEYAEENLAQTLSHRPLSPTETRDLLEPTFEALGYLHSKGFIHGHIQPSNILAVRDQLKLSSDGISRLGELGDRQDGHDPYRAPESAVGDLSPASDVWALGMMVVKCLTQRLPEPSEGNRGVVSLPVQLPVSFLEIARHCLNVMPKRRWSISTLKTRLHRSSAALEEVPAPVRSVKPSKQRRPFALTAMGIAATMILGITLFHFDSGTGQTRAAGIESTSAQRSGPLIAKDQAPVLQTQLAPSVAKPPAAKDSDYSSESSRLFRLSPASDSARGSVAHRALPDVPRSASDTIRGTVRVRVRVDVDTSGNVVNAGFDSAGPSRYFAHLSMDAARQWRFNPPDANAQDRPSEWVILFNYTNDGATASATRLSR